MFVLAASLVGCTFDYTHSASISAADDLPELGVDCDPDDSDTVRDDGTRVVTRVAPIDGACHASVVTSTEVVDWTEVRAEIDGQAGKPPKVTWVDADALFDSLTVQTEAGELPAVGTHVSVAELLSTDAARHAALEDDLPSLVDALVDGSLADYPEHLVSFDHTLAAGDAADLAGVIRPLVTGERVAALIGSSFDADDALHLITVSDVTVPDAALAELGSVVLTIDVTEGVDLAAELKVSLF